VSDFLKFKNDLNTTKVTPELLGAVMVMYASLSPEERIFEARAKRVIDLLHDRGHGTNCGFLAMAITIRLMALDVILKDHEVQGWTLPGGGPDVTYVPSYLLKVAAEAPLVEGPNGQPIFDSTRLSTPCSPNCWDQRARMKPGRKARREGLLPP
jgi:hypothetical protein